MTVAIATAPRRIDGERLTLSRLGLGCWEMGGGDYWGAMTPETCRDIVHTAYDLGVRYFDTAESYNEGRSEAALGRALAELPRGAVTIGTKIAPHHCRPGGIEAACEASLRRLGTDYIDLYQIHWPVTPGAAGHFAADPDAARELLPAAEVMRRMERLRRAGKIRHFGVSNFGVERLRELLAAGAPPVATNELPYSLLTRNAEDAVFPYCRERGIGVIGYMSLLQGVLTRAWDSFEQLAPAQRRTRHFDSRNNPAIRHGGRGFEDETRRALRELDAACREVGRPLAEVALQWAAQHPAVCCTLVGVRKAERLRRNAAAVAAPMDPALRARLAAATERLKELLGPGFDYYEAPENDRTR